MKKKIKNMNIKSGMKYWVIEIAYLLLKILALLLTVILIRQSLFGVAIIYGKSMEPNFSEGDRIVYISVGYRPQRGDVVLCRTGKGNKNELIKRIIGLPGDVVEIDKIKGVVIVNGQELEEPYLSDLTFETGDITYPFTVPKGQYFVLGDNRNVSLDSRFSEIGTLERERIDGRVIFRFFPFSKFKVIK